MKDINKLKAKANLSNVLCYEDESYGVLISEERSGGRLPDDWLNAFWFHKAWFDVNNIDIIRVRTSGYITLYLKDYSQLSQCSDKEYALTTSITFKDSGMVEITSKTGDPVKTSDNSIIMVHVDLNNRSLEYTKLHNFGDRWPDRDYLKEISKQDKLGIINSVDTIINGLVASHALQELGID